MKKTYRESSKSGALVWFWQRISAVILFVMLLFHFVSYHFMAKGSYEWSRVVTKMQSPWFNLIQFMFLITALYHGLNGVWMVSEDYIHSRPGRIVVLSILFVLGISLFFIGTLTIFKVASMSIHSSLPGGVK
jgi:succinate dehydrogenase / fumarate reductase membrane anchor subunit